MTRSVAALGSVAVIVVASALALNFYANQQGIGGQPTPTPPMPTASPSPTASPTPILGGPLSDCVDLYANGGTYRATLGTISVEATVPARWSGLRDKFYLVNAPCVFGGSAELRISLVGEVFNDACDWPGARVDAATPAAVTAALAAQEGHETTGPTNTSLAGYPASRFEISVPADFDTTACDDGGPIYLWQSPGADGRPEVPMDPGVTATVYVVDVDGTTLGVAATRRERDATPAQIAELDAVVASLRFEP